MNWLSSVGYIIIYIRAYGLNFCFVIFLFFCIYVFLEQLRARVDAVSVGKLSLNLTGFNGETASIFGNRITSAIQSLLPFSQYIPLTVDYLNTATLQPKKNNQTGRCNILESNLLLLFNSYSYHRIINLHEQFFACKSCSLMIWTIFGLRLIPGVLQLAQGTHLTIDESHLQPGNLDSNGVHNARLLKKLIEQLSVIFFSLCITMPCASDMV